VVTASRVVAFKAALTAALTAAPGLERTDRPAERVQVSYGFPSAGVEDEIIYLGNVRGRHDPGAIRRSRQPRAEQFTLDLFIEITDSGGDAETAEARTFDLFRVVEGVLADDPTLGAEAGSTQWARVGEFELRSGVEEQGWSTSLRVEIEVSARLE